MAIVPFDQTPLITDTVAFTFMTVDQSGSPVTPYDVQNVTVYFLARDYNSTAELMFPGVATTPFSEAVPTLVMGNASDPAWVDGGPEPQQVEQQANDPITGLPTPGVFTFDWSPIGARDGDYVLTWTWTLVPDGDTSASSVAFTLAGDSAAYTAIPTHRTPPQKWETLLNLWLPEMFKVQILDADLTPVVLNNFLNSVAGVWTVLEDLVASMLDLQDANAIPEAMLPYLSNLFNWKLRSYDPTLWRRQIKEVPNLFKQKGTLPCLRNALSASGIHLIGFEMLWQIVSPWTWQEILYPTAGQQSFDLVKVPTLPSDTVNYAVATRKAGQSFYTTQAPAFYQFGAAAGEGSLTWSGPPFATGDILLVLYAVTTPTDQALENYIRTLPLSDDRDEMTVTLPPKNANVRLASENDPYFDRMCPFRNPYRQPLIYGQIRTEMPYSEKAYNTDEFDGSLRDSSRPCDIGPTFLDDCACGRSSRYAVNLEISDLNTNRIAEAQEIMNEFVPFHATPAQLNISGGLEDTLVPQQENIYIFGTIGLEEFVIQGPPEFNRTIQPNFENLNRSALADIIEATVQTDGVGYSLASTIFAPTFNFGDMNVDDCVVELLSGVNQGEYAVTNACGHILDVLDWADIPFPNDQSSFPFRLSRPWWQGYATVTQADVSTFSDASVALVATGVEGGATPPWTIQVLGGIYAGSYSVAGVRADGGIVLNGWPSPAAPIGLSWQLLNPAGVAVATASTGAVSVRRQGVFGTGDDLSVLNVQPGFWVLIDGEQYLITAVIDQHSVYIDGYAAGDTADSAVIFRRDMDGQSAQIGYRGMRLETSLNHYVSMGVAALSINDFLVLIGTTYYQIVSWSSTVNGDGRYDIVLTGAPTLLWGMTGTPDITYSILQFQKTSSVTVGTTVLDHIDRSPQTEVIDVATTMAFRAAMLNSSGKGQPSDWVHQEEDIEIIATKVDQGGP